MDRDNWKTNITTSPKLRTYCTFKENPYLETYVYKIKNRQDRSVFSKLRFGILPLQVEIGRWQNIKFEDRVCQICHTGVEDKKTIQSFIVVGVTMKDVILTKTCAVYKGIGHFHPQKNLEFLCKRKIF